MAETVDSSAAIAEVAPYVVNLAANWWDSINKSHVWQDRIFHILAILYGIVSAVALVKFLNSLSLISLQFLISRVSDYSRLELTSLIVIWFGSFSSTFFCCNCERGMKNGNAFWSFRVRLDLKPSFGGKFDFVVLLA